MKPQSLAICLLLASCLWPAVVECGQAPVGQGADASSVGWTEILAEAIQLRAKVEHGNKVRVHAKWRGTTPHILDVFFEEPAATVVYPLVPWQSFSGSPGEPVTVTEHSLVFLSSKPAPSAKWLREISLERVSEAADAARNEKRSATSDAPRLPHPLSGQIRFQARHYSRYDVENLDLSVPEQQLARLTPGMMLWLVEAGESPSDLWIKPAPYEPKRTFDPAEQRLEPGVDLKAAGRQMDGRLRGIFGDAIRRARLSEDISEGARRKILREAHPAVRKAVFDYPGHSGPAFAAGAAALEGRMGDLARMLALDPSTTPEVRFPGYEPKTSLDTALDLRPGLGSAFRALPPASLSELPKLLGLLDVAKEEAAKGPGRWVDGQIQLGADQRQYEPSDAELRAAEIGDRIRRVVGEASAEALRHVLSRAEITATKVEYKRFEFRHVHVMGSGRFTYASGPVATTVQLDKE